MHDLLLDIGSSVLVAKNLCCSAVGSLGHLVPRSPRRIAFGSSQHNFNGNAKYLYLHLLREEPSLEVAWVSPDRAVVDDLRRRGLPAYWTYDPRGLLFCLTAGVFVYHGRPTDINQWAMAGAVDINLWHGVGIKGLGFHSTSPANRRLFAPGSLFRRLANPHLYHVPSYFVSTSPLMTDHFARAFRMDTERCLELGYPRNDHFFLAPEALDRFVREHESPEYVAFVDRLRGYSRRVLYMPTYRDNDEDFIRLAGIDFDRLEATMAALDGVFVFKLHPWTRLELPAAGRYPHLVFMDKTLDVYPLLPYVDLLVTDYSSVYYDYLLLDGDILLFPFDYEHYQGANRDLFLDFDEHTPGRRVTTFDALLEALEAPPGTRTDEQRRIKELFWGSYAGDASQSITEHILGLVAAEEHGSR